MESLCLVVPRKDGEVVRRKLLDEGVLRKDLVIERDALFLFMPVSRHINLGYGTATREFKQRKAPSGDYRALLDLPPDLRELLPSSMDIIGDVIVLKLPDELRPRARSIAEALARVHKAKTVAVDSGVAGDLRLRRLELVFGHETRTVHREFGLEFELDVARVYFSPRLSTERKRISGLVKDGEVVIDMFCGAGPFSIMLAKHARPKRIYAIDLNPDAIDFLRGNVARNGAEGIVAVQGDAREVVRGLEKADRIIMNLPLSSFEFFEAALGAAGPGCTIHYYELLHKEKALDRCEELRKKALGLGKDLEANVRELRTYSPTTAHFAFDLRVLT